LYVLIVGLKFYYIVFILHVHVLFCVYTIIILPVCNIVHFEISYNLFAYHHWNFASVDLTK